VTLQVPDQTVPFGYPTEVEATVSSETGAEVTDDPGAVTFLVDGDPVGDPVPIEDGTASTELIGLEPGDNLVTALYEGEAGLAARTFETLAVDSAAPEPAGILPCAGRSVVLTMAYRSGKSMEFEGVARYSLRGETVRIQTGGRVVASAEVESDGTFWTSARDPRGQFGGRTEFTARIGSAESWPRRVGQAVTVTGRSPGGQSRAAPRITVRGLLRELGIRRVVLARQVGCRKQEVVAVRQVGSARSGTFAMNIPRPDTGEPYAIYRLLTGSGIEVSPPIVVRPQG
jgi:hypothetical protein